MKRYFSNKNFTIGFILSVVVILVAVISLLWTPYDGNKMNARARLQGPSWQHPLGTDQYGRDTLSRIMVGAVNSIIVGLVTVAIGLSIGVILGLASAYYGKLMDEVIMRFSDFLFTYPACPRRSNKFPFPQRQSYRPGETGKHRDVKNADGQHGVDH